jgi:hypothetical protein
MTPPAKTKRAVFSIHERNGKTYWTRIGAATENRDGSLTLKLDALPLGSTLHIRDDVRDDVKKENPDG